MTIQTLARKQLDQKLVFHFSRKNTSDCYWFDLGVLRSYSDTDLSGRRASLDIDDLAASDWRIIR